MHKKVTQKLNGMFRQTLGHTQPSEVKENAIIHGAPRSTYQKGNYRMLKGMGKKYSNYSTLICVEISTNGKKYQNYHQLEQATGVSHSFNDTERAFEMLKEEESSSMLQFVYNWRNRATRRLEGKFKSFPKKAVTSKMISHQKEMFFLNQFILNNL